jgi:hypothetical protein
MSVGIDYMFIIVFNLYATENPRRMPRRRGNGRGVTPGVCMRRGGSSLALSVSRSRSRTRGDSKRSTALGISANAAGLNERTAVHEPTRSRVSGQRSRHIYVIPVVLTQTTGSVLEATVKLLVRSWMHPIIHPPRPTRTTASLIHTMQRHAVPLDT